MPTRPLEEVAQALVDLYWRGENGPKGASANWLPDARRHTAHAALALKRFVESGTLVDQVHFLRHLLVLPLQGPVAVAAPLDGDDYIVVGQQFIELLRFDYQVNAGLRLAEFLVRSGRPLAYWAGHEWIHAWFLTLDRVPDLAPHVRSPLPLGLESDCLMQGLLFMVCTSAGTLPSGMPRGPQ